MTIQLHTESKCEWKISIQMEKKPTKNPTGRVRKKEIQRRHTVRYKYLPMYTNGFEMTS